MDFPEPDERRKQIIDASCDRHHQSAHVPFADYRRQIVYGLEAFLVPRKKVYLDTNYWISIRNPTESRFPKESQRLLELLQRGVATGKLICPFAYPHFGELMAIGDMDKRMPMARLMDSLGCGVALKNPFHTAAIEYSRFMVEKASFLNRFARCIEPVWCAVGQFLGEQYPNADWMTEDIRNHAHKVALDGALSLRIEDLAQSVDVPQEKTTAQRINEERKIFPRGDQSFEDMYRSELHAYLDGNRDMIVTSFREVASLAKVEGADQAEPTDEMMIPMIGVLREATLKLKNRTLPSQQIEAALHAAMRMDDRRQMKQNDIEDVHHGANALAYCDVFLTERSLTSLVRMKCVQDVIPIGCQIECEPSKAVDLIESIVG